MKSKSRRIISTCTFASILLTSSLTGIKVSAVTPPENPRLWGTDRYETAVKISEKGWTTSEYAVIASGEGYADALSAAPLAKIKNAPILLTKKDSISESSLKELKRLGVTHVYIAGGEGAISKEVENKIKTVVTTIERLEGKDRYETSVKIAEKLGKVDKAIIASGEGYADALSAAPVAAIKGIPVLLTKANELPSSTKEYLKSARVTTTFVIGGVAAVSEGVVKVLPEAKRVAGKDRFETNAEVLRAFATDFDFGNAYMALGVGPKGNEFADALAGAALSTKSEGPVILTGKDLNKATKEVAKEKLSPTSVITILGGTANISDALVNSIKITAESLDKEGTEYDKDYPGNAVITGKNIIFKNSTVKGDLYVEGNNATLTNLKVEGTVYVNPGKDGEATLDNVEAKDIVVLSGAEKTIRLRNVKANLLNVLNRAVTRVVVEGGTELKATSALSNIILEVIGGTFGDINIPKTVLEKAVEVRGNIDKPVVIGGNVDFKVAAGATLTKVEIKSQSTEKVTLGGNLGTVEVHTAANIKMAEGAKATIKATTEEAKASAKVDVPEGTDVKVEEFKKDNVVVTPPVTPPAPPVGGGGGGGPVTPVAKDYTVTIKIGGETIETINAKENTTLNSLYTSIATKANEEGSLKEKAKLGTNLFYNKAKAANVGGKNGITYLVEKLNSYGATTLATYINNYDNNRSEVTEFHTNTLLYFKSRTLSGLYGKFFAKESIGLPAVVSGGGATLQNIQVLKGGTEIAEYTAGSPIITATLKTNLKTALDTNKELYDLTLKELSSKSFKVVANSDSGASYELSSDGSGNITITAMGKTLNIKVAEKTN